MTDTPDIEPEDAPQVADALNEGALDPGELEAGSFPITRRGFDPAEVRAQLRAAASEIRRLQRLCNELRGRLSESQQAGRSDAEARRATELIGVEVSSVLEAAHDAAASRIARADSEAEAISHEARAAAEAVLADATAQSTELIEAARHEAGEIVEESRNHGREMISEAQTVRERMLRDLARKRQTGRAQIEQLRAGRDRLLEALTTVQNSLDTAIEDLVASVPEARAAANRAGLRVSSEPAPTVDDLEAEIEAGRLVGQPLVSDSPLPGPISDTFTTGEMEALDHLDALSVHAGETADEAVAEP
ncbi:MAG: DivIVA domain-containing protein, partial [Acidimicrobiaceae bacterium]|nr:DivIVA domain-containing protein [Acidimicrobiaceae bacterium]